MQLKNRIEKLEQILGALPDENVTLVMEIKADCDVEYYETLKELSGSDERITMTEKEVSRLIQGAIKSGSIKINVQLVD